MSEFCSQPSMTTLCRWSMDNCIYGIAAAAFALFQTLCRLVSGMKTQPHTIPYRLEADIAAHNIWRHVTKVCKQQCCQLTLCPFSAWHAHEASEFDHKARSYGGWKSNLQHRGRLTKASLTHLSKNAGRTACFLATGQAAHSSEHDSLEGEEGSTHLNGTAEGDFTITLAKMHVTHTQVGALNEDWKVHLSCQTSCLLCFSSNT